MRIGKETLLSEKSTHFQHASLLIILKEQKLAEDSFNVAYISLEILTGLYMIHWKY